MWCLQFTHHLCTKSYIQLTKFLRDLHCSCIQLIWSPMTLKHNIPFFLCNIFLAFPAKNSVRTSAAGLAKLWHACPKLHLERYSWYAAFTAVPICFIYFVRPEFVYSAQCLCICVCIYIYTSDTVQTVYKLPLLPNNTAVKHFYTNRSVAKCWLDIYRWGAVLAATGRIRDIGQNVLFIFFKTGSSSSPVTGTFCSLSHSSGRT